MNKIYFKGEYMTKNEWRKEAEKYISLSKDIFYAFRNEAKEKAFSIISLLNKYE